MTTGNLLDRSEGKTSTPASSGTTSGVITLKAFVFVFAASSATLVLELVAGRMLSPFIGVSLETWTAIIGVVLAGVSLGNWIGGKIADRYPTPRTAAVLMLLAGVSALATLGIIALLGDGTVLRPITLLTRTFLLTTIVFLPPSLILGMVTPVVIRLLLPDVGKAGTIVGMVYALGTLGSLVGNFLTGFVLVAYLPVNTIVLGVSAFCFLLGFLGGEWWRKPAARAGVAPGTRAEDSNLPVRPEPASHASPLGSEQAARQKRRGRLYLPGNVPLACVVVVIASFCTMAIELAASRILAPYVGVSLYSWTGIIGVVLAGITIGNTLGGRIADRWPRQHVLGASLFIGGLGSLSILPAIGYVTGQGLFNSLGLMERIVATTAAVFFVPVLLLGLISPQVIKLVIVDLAHAGRTSGRVYAWSTAGAIAGTFATGWILVSLLGVYTLILIAGLVLIALAFTVGRFWRNAVAVVVSIAVASGAVWGISAREATKSPCAVETNYFCIKVYDESRNGFPVKSLVLDHLVHSYVKIGDPSYLGYEHEQVQAEITRLVSSRRSNPGVLVIGGGGYTYPRWVEAFVPGAKIEVAEIDPGVTEANYSLLGLSRNTGIISHNLDGRQFVREIAPRKGYNLVVQDAVNDLSVPYHILTKEYNDAIRDILADDGIYLLTVIDLYQDGQLLRSSIRTMMQSFPEVQLLGAHPSWNYGGSSVFVIYGANKKLDFDELRRALKAQGIDQMLTQAQPQEDTRAYVAAGPQIVLTDQYAPVDNLISILFKSRN